MGELPRGEFLKKGSKEWIERLQPTFRRCPQENNIFLAIVFGYLLENLKSLSQLKLPEIEVKALDEVT